MKVVAFAAFMMLIAFSAGCESRPANRDANSTGVPHTANRPVTDDRTGTTGDDASGTATNTPPGQPGATDPAPDATQPPQPQTPQQQAPPQPQTPQPQTQP